MTSVETTKMVMPSGITITLDVYVTNDAVKAKLSLSGMKSIPREFNESEIAVLLKSLPPLGGNWRLMTDGEVADYLTEDAADANDGDDQEEF
jgi:hypothetical protein